MKVQIYQSARSLGIHAYARHLASSLAAIEDVSVCLSSVLDTPAGDVLDFQLGNSTRRLWLALLRARRFSRIVVTLHDVLPHDPWLRRVLGRPQLLALRALAATVLVHSEAARELARNLGIEKVRVVPHGVPRHEVDRAASRRALGVSDDAMVFVLAGHIKRSRGGLKVLRALREIPEARLLVVGPEVEREVRAALDAFDQHRLVRLGRVDDSAFVRAIGCADALLNYREDDLGAASGPAMTALGAGIPVLEGVADEGRIRLDVRRFLVDMTFRGVLTAEACERRERECWPRVAQQRVAIYKEMLAGAGGDLQQTRRPGRAPDPGATD